MIESAPFCGWQVAGKFGNLASTMSFTILGINHTTAKIAVRERVAFAADQLVEALQEGCRHIGLQELDDEQ